MKYSSQSGSVLTMAFAALAIVGVLAFSTFQFISGPVRSTSVVGLKTKVQSDQQIAARLIFNNSGNSDGDPEIEPVNPETNVLAPSGGGIVPTTVGAAARDPWGTPYGYCAWNHGSNAAASGNILAGATTGYDSLPFAALISAGADRTFQTSCIAISPFVTSSGDDNIEVFMYQTGATAASGGGGGGGSGGLWEKAGSDAQYTTDSVIVGNISTPSSAKFQVADDAQIGGGVSILNSASANLDGGLTLGGTGTLTIPGLSTAGSVTVDGTLTLNTLTGISATVDPAGIVENLNADLLDGRDSLWIRDWANKTNKDFPLTAMPAITGDVTFNDSTGEWGINAIMGKAVVNTGLANWESLRYNSSQNRWESLPVDAYGDVETGSSGTRDTAIVKRIRGNPVSNAAPSTNMVLGWDGSTWKPMTVAMTGSASAVGVASGAVNFLGTGANITSALCSSGHFPKYNGTTWNCTTDSYGTASLPINFDNINPDSTNPTRRIMHSESANDPFFFFYGSNNTFFGLNAGAGIDALTTEPTSGAGTGNVFLGTSAGEGATVTQGVVALGGNAFADGGGASGDAGRDSVFVGYNAGIRVRGAATNTNVMVGYQAGGYASNTNAASGSDNVYIGSEAGYRAKTSTGATCIGRQACMGSSDYGTDDVTAAGYQAAGGYGGASSVYIGSGAGRQSVAGNSVYFGKDAQENYGGTNGGNVVFGASSGGGLAYSGVVIMGYQTMNSASGGGSTVLGYQAFYNGGNNYNVSIGAQSGYNKTYGEGNIILGYRAGACASPNDNFRENVVIGRNVLGTTCGVGGGWNTFIGNDGVTRAGPVYWVFTMGHNVGSAAVDMTGHDNMFVGNGAATAVTSSTLNTVLGHGAATTLTTGVGNIVIGRGRDVPTAATNDWFVMGSSRAGVGDILWGDMSTGNLVSKYLFDPPSDVRLKRDIHPIENALARVKRIKGVIYKWRKDYIRGDGERDHLGVIAQDLLYVAPEAVFKQGDMPESKYYAVSYESLVPLLVDAVNAQDEKLVRVEEKMKELKGGKDVQ